MVRNHQNYLEIQVLKYINKFIIKSTVLQTSHSLVFLIN